MPSDRVDEYAAAFAARCKATLRDGQTWVDERGVRGLIGSAGEPQVRLLVTDDRAESVLARLLPRVEAGTIEVFDAAERCAALVGAEVEWRSELSTAMLRPDLADVPDLPFPPELSLRPVRRTADDVGGVALEDAVAVAMRADGRIEGPPEAFAAFLRSLPPGARLYCAVEEDGPVRATAGVNTFGAETNVFFVNTDPNWQRRGIGRAMTAAALRAARDAGARRATLHATAAGLSVYLGLGFESVGRATRFSRPYRSGR